MNPSLPVSVGTNALLNIGAGTVVPVNGAAGSTFNALILQTAQVSASSPALQAGGGQSLPGNGETLPPAVTPDQSALVNGDDTLQQLEQHLAADVSADAALFPEQRRATKEQLAETAALVVGAAQPKIDVSVQSEAQTTVLAQSADAAVNKSTIDDADVQAQQTLLAKAVQESIATSQAIQNGQQAAAQQAAAVDTQAVQQTQLSQQAQQAAAAQQQLQQQLAAQRSEIQRQPAQTEQSNVSSQQIAAAGETVAQQLTAAERQAGSELLNASQAAAQGQLPAEGEQLPAQSQTVAASLQSQPQPVSSTRIEIADRVSERPLINNGAVADLNAPQDPLVQPAQQVPVNTPTQQTTDSVNAVAGQVAATRVTDSVQQPKSSQLAVSAADDAVDAEVPLSPQVNTGGERKVADETASRVLNIPQSGVASDSLARLQNSASLLTDQLAEQPASNQASRTSAETKAEGFSDTLTGVLNNTAAARAEKAGAENYQLQLQPGLKPGTPAWGQAVNERIVWLSSQQGKTAEIRLDPPELGSLQVKLEVKNEQVSVVFNTPHASVKESLEQHMPRLKEMFAEQGLELADSSVEDQSSQQREEAQQREALASGGYSAQGEIDSESQAAESAVVQNISLVDYYA